MENTVRYSRRLFLGAGLAAATRAQQQKKTFLYTGCYTQRGKGIGIYEMEAATGALTPAGTAAFNPATPVVRGIVLKSSPVPA